MNNVVEAIVMTCPRCGKQVIRIKTGETDMDGGFSKVNEYEPVPSDWKILKEYDQFFCPFCCNEYDNRLKGFLEYNRRG